MQQKGEKYGVIVGSKQKQKNPENNSGRALTTLTLVGHVASFTQGSKNSLRANYSRYTWET